ncbi:MAG: thioredoxin family protein [Candidatus Geothermincolia bacterium]
MTVKGAKMALLLLAVGLIVALVPVCGCGTQKKTVATNAGGTCPTTVPQTSSPESQSTTPSTSADASKSEAALALAKAEGKPVLIKFGSGTCIPCKQIEENINTVKPEYEGKVAFIIVDVYEQSENNLTTQYGIQTIPTTFFLGKDGSIVNNQIGVLTPDQLKQQLDALL